MKRNLLLMLSLLVNSTALFSQSCQGPSLLSTDFNDGSIPGNWTILNLDSNTLYWNMLVKGYTGAWQPYSHYGRQCVTSASRYDDYFNYSDDYLVTPAITLGPAPVCLSWKSSRAYDSPQFADETYDVLVSTTDPTVNGLHSNPTLISVDEVHENWIDYSVDLSAYAGQTVYIGFWQYTMAGYALCLDDIKIASPVSVDAAATALNVSDLYQPNATIPIAGTLVNGGLNAITSLSLNWNVDGGTVHSDNLTGLNIGSQEYYDFSLSSNWIPSSTGSYLLKVWADNVNGSGDGYHLNDTVAQVVYVSNYPRKVLMEEFTNASCPPCADQNPAYDALVDANRTNGKATAIKYHVGWPGYDPMNDFNASDPEDRVAYYGVYGVPFAVTDGAIKTLSTTCYTGQPACIDQAYLDTMSAMPSIFGIDISTSTDGSNYIIEAMITAKTDIADNSFTAQVILLEDMIDYGYAPGSNGEIVFGEVLRKMLPSSDGTALPLLLNGESAVLNYSAPIEPEYNEDQLRTLVFIQNENGKKIYQSEMTDVNYETGVQPNMVNDNNFKIYPNPANNILMISSKTNVKEAIIAISNSIGEEVLKLNYKDVMELQTINISQLTAGIYFIHIETDNNTAIEKFVKQ